MLSIPATKGFEYGSGKIQIYINLGFEGVSMKGSEHNDAFHK